MISPLLKLSRKQKFQEFIFGWLVWRVACGKKQTNKQTNKQASKQANKQTNKQQTLTQTKIIHPNHEMLKTRPRMPFVGSPGLTPAGNAGDLTQRSVSPSAMPWVPMLSKGEMKEEMRKVEDHWKKNNSWWFQPI